MTSSVNQARSLLRSQKPRNIEAGIEIIRELSSSGVHEAIYAEATWYVFGVNGYPHNEAKGRELLMAAIEGNVVDAFVDLANLEINGNSKTRFRDAFGWFLSAAVLGDVQSREYIVDCMRVGQGVYKNPSAAVHLARAWGLQPRV